MLLSLNVLHLVLRKSDGGSVVVARLTSQVTSALVLHNDTVVCGGGAAGGNRILAVGAKGDSGSLRELGEDLFYLVTKFCLGRGTMRCRKNDLGGMQNTFLHEFVHRGTGMGSLLARQVHRRT